MNEPTGNDANSAVGSSRESWFEKNKALEYISRCFQADKKEIRTVKLSFNASAKWGVNFAHTSVDAFLKA
jgi:hypothetical protein